MALFLMLSPALVIAQPVFPSAFPPHGHTGMRIEDMFLVTASGIENLSANLPEDPDKIQALMAGNRRRWHLCLLDTLPSAHP